MWGEKHAMLTNTYCRPAQKQPTTQRKENWRLSWRRQERHTLASSSDVLQVPVIMDRHKFPVSKCKVQLSKWSCQGKTWNPGTFQIIPWASLKQEHEFSSFQKFKHTSLAIIFWHLTIKILHCFKIHCNMMRFVQGMVTTFPEKIPLELVEGMKTVLLLHTSHCFQRPWAKLVVSKRARTAVICTSGLTGS